MCGTDLIIGSKIWQYWLSLSLEILVCNQPVVIAARRLILIFLYIKLQNYIIQIRFQTTDWMSVETLHKMYAVSICTVAVCYTLKCYMHGSSTFQLNYCRAQNFKMLRARQSNYYQKILPCTIP